MSIREHRSALTMASGIWALLALGLLAPVFIAILWGDVHEEAAYQQFQQARAMAQNIDHAWAGFSPLYTLLLALATRLSWPLPAVALALSVVGWMVAVAGLFLTGLELGRPMFAAAAAILLALHPLQAQALGLESGLVLGLFGLATLWAARGQRLAMLITTVLLVATAPTMVVFVAPFVIFSHIWRRSLPTLGHIVVSVCVGATCYGLVYLLIATPPDGTTTTQLELTIPLLVALQLLAAATFGALVPDFDWLIRPIAGGRALQRGLVALGLVALVCWQGYSLADDWRMRFVDRPALYRTIASWLRDYTLPTETIGASQAGVLGYLSDRSALALPDTTQPSILLAAIDRLRPDYCIALNSLTWHGAQSQPWFQQRYEQTYQFTSPYDSAAPLTVFRYTPSPFDAGEIISVTARFTPDTKEWIELTGFRLDTHRVTPNEPLHLSLYWRPKTKIRHRLFLVLRMIDQASGTVWTEIESRTPGGISTHLWNSDAHLTDNLFLVAPADLPPGDYALDVALYRQGDDSVPILAGGLGDALQREPITLTKVYRPQSISTTPSMPDHPLEFVFEEEITLLGYDAPERIAPGENLRVALYWHALRAVPLDYKVFVHLLASNDQLLAQRDSPPLDWAYPTTSWQPGEYIRDEHVLITEPSVPRGDYWLSIGLYDTISGERAFVRNSDGAEMLERRVLLQQIRVR